MHAGKGGGTGPADPAAARPIIYSEITRTRVITRIFLNQVRAGHRPARAWFLKIDPVRIVGMHVCVCVRA